MSKTLVIGSTGKIGSLLLPMLQQADIDTLAMARDPAKLAHLQGIDFIEANLEDDFEHAVSGCDRVVFTAGSGASTGPDKTLLIDLWAARKAVDYAIKHHVKHFVMISSRGADDPDAIDSPIKPYLVAKCMADDYLLRSGLPYTILRPGKLTDDGGTGQITTRRPEQLSAQHIARADVARVITRVLSTGQSKNVIYELYEGETPIEDLIA
ncbi:SDR family oxidoreductase [Halopseudomonas sabulinigri]|uniref:SDR family oxidoreductase n=1 Tax=Halopseudomonas sabulinigri TaxID=472181 RepID=A0ABP9ZSW8_9GAMM